ncbi:MAG: hypothetical protein NXH81_12800 [Halieaceae bacterium]|uniref:hypothetical protein n=1 Tax=Haliea alexandrii TaxID=2448162 RepID=UPI00130492C8|nr:hypothetical protein [Haliea alexandrii]MCR9186270.1 hypothetical protein [Halieaceae bacterium]
MRVVESSPDVLEIEIALPGFAIWFMLGPFVLFGGLVTLAMLLGGEFLDALSTGMILAIIVFIGHYFITRTTHLRLERDTGRVSVRRCSRFEKRTCVFPLRDLDSAEVSQNIGHGRSTSRMTLVFSSTRPATRVPLSAWAVSGGGVGDLVDAINDWLTCWRDANLRNSPEEETAGP